MNFWLKTSHLNMETLFAPCLVRGQCGLSAFLISTYKKYRELQTSWINSTAGRLYIFISFWARWVCQDETLCNTENIFSIKLVSIRLSQSKYSSLFVTILTYLLYWIVEKQYHRSSGRSKSNKNTCDKNHKSTNPDSFIIHVVLLTFVSLVSG